VENDESTEQQINLLRDIIERRISDLEDFCELHDEDQFGRQVMFKKAMMDYRKMLQHTNLSSLSKPNKPTNKTSVKKKPLSEKKIQSVETPGNYLNVNVIFKYHF